MYQIIVPILLALVLGWSGVAEAQAVFSTTCKFSWNPNSESDLAGYRAWVDKGGVQKPIVTIPVGPTPNTSCAALGVDSDGVWNFNVLAFDNAATANLSSVATIAGTKDTVAPDTTVAATVAGGGASFVLTSNEPTVTYECQLDGSAFAQCTTPRNYTGLTDGAHSFAARAKDAAGNLDATPATYAWTVNVTAPSQPSGLSITPNFP